MLRRVVVPQEVVARAKALMPQDRRHGSRAQRLIYKLSRLKVGRIRKQR